MWVVEVHRTTGVAGPIGQMQGWLDDRGIKPRLFSLDARCFQFEFEDEADAIAFASAFDGGVRQPEHTHHRPAARGRETRRCQSGCPLIPSAVPGPPFAPAVIVRRDPPAAAMRDITAVWICVAGAWAERASHGSDRAANQRPGRGSAATTGNRTDSGARPGARLDPACY